MYHWMSQFAQYAFKNLNEEQTESIKQLAIALLKPNYFIDGTWVADYKRLRIKAIKR
jgi:hypothetical protein